MKLKSVELKLCSSAEGCDEISCPHIKPHKTITKGDNKCKSVFCLKVGMHINCETYIFEREISGFTEAYNNRVNAPGRRDIIVTKRR